jgi:hypothetical protein
MSEPVLLIVRVVNLATPPDAVIVKQQRRAA